MALERKLELTRDDLLGFDPEELQCNQCAGTFCGLRVGRVLEGKALIMCTRKEAAKEVLTALGKR